MVYALWSRIPITNADKVFWLQNQLKWWIAVKGTRSAFNLFPEQLEISTFFVWHFALAGNKKLVMFEGKIQTTSSWERTDALGYFPAISKHWDIYSVPCASFSLVSQGDNTLFPSSLSKVMLKIIANMKINSLKQKVTSEKMDDKFWV